MMTGKEKLYFLLNRIEDKRVLTASGQPVLIHPMGDLNGEYPNIELMLLFKKLQDDEKVLRVTRTPLSEEEKGYNPRYEDDYYGLELLPTFDEYFAKIQLESEYQAFTGRKRVAQARVVPETQPSQDNQTDVAYEITYSGSREILLNKTFQLAKPDFDSENDLVFNYLYEHPNQKFTRGQLEEAIGRKLTKSLHKIVENLGFEGETKEVFFSVSKTAIEFRNPITKKYLEQMRMARIKPTKGTRVLLFEN